VSALIRNRCPLSPEYATGLLAQNKVEIVGHRGASFTAPENTLASVKKGVELGADAIEVDIHFSKDGELVVIHDATTKRTTGVEYTVAETNYSEMKSLDAGSFKSDEYAGEPIPLLNDIIDYLPNEIALYIEIKGPIDLVPSLTTLLNKYPEKRKQFRIIAFDIETLTEAKRQMSDIPCYYLKSIVARSKHREFVADLKTRGLDGADLNFRTITPRLVRILAKNNMPCLAWTVNSTDQATKLIDMGVVGITTDKPDLLKQGL